MKENLQCDFNNKNIHIDKLDYIVDKHNNTCHSTIKMKSVDAETNAYINSNNFLIS